MSNIIENNAFNQCDNLKDIQIPLSVEEISNNIINNCENIENIMGNDIIKSIEDCYLIKNGVLISIAKELSHYVIPEGVTSIGYGVFKNNLDAEYILVPNTVTSIEDEAFRNCRNLKSIQLSNNVKSLGNLCFENCSSLTSLHIPDSVTSVGVNLLDGCTSLEELYMSPNIDLSGDVYDLMSDVKENIVDGIRYQGNILLGVQDDTLEHYNIKEGTILISKYAFSSCANMKTVKIPSSVLYIQEHAFEGCNLESIDLPEGVIEIGYSAFGSSTTSTSLKIPSTVKTIKDYAFRGNNFNEVKILGDIENIGNGFLYNSASHKYALVVELYCSKLPKVTDRTFINDKYTYICIKDELLNSEDLSPEWQNYKNNGMLLSLDEGGDKKPFINYEFNSTTGLLKIMGDASIPGCYTNAQLEERPWHSITSSIKRIELSNGIKEIGKSAFEDCVSLESIHIGENVKSIHMYAFKNCVKLKSISFPNSVTEIVSGALYGCSSLEEITFGKGITSIDDNYIGCNSLKRITLSDSIKKLNIEKSTAVDVYYLGTISQWVSIDLESSLSNVYINNQKLSDITNVTLSNTITSICKYAFYNCEKLTKITIPNTVTTIEDYAFKNCKSLTNIVIPDSVISIGRDAFYDCESLTSVTIGNGVTSIGERAFEGCSSLTSVTIGNSVTSIGRDAFNYCTSLTSITIPNSVTDIGGWAFNYCTSLTSVTIPNSVTSIGERAFRFCSSLTSITIPDSVTSIGDYAFENCDSLTSVTIPDTVTELSFTAFSACDNLKEITIPDNLLTDEFYRENIDLKINGNNYYNDGFVIIGTKLIRSITSKEIPDYITEIGERAFNNVTIKSITIPNSVISIGKEAFYNSSIGEITFGNGLKNIDSGAFRACRLTNISLPNTITSIKDYTFCACNLTSMTIPDSVTSIGDAAFSGCSSLTSVTIPDSVTEIGDSAFAYCTSLTSVTIGNSVTSIGDHAFENCTSLESVTIPASVTSIGYRTFMNCKNLTSLTIEDSFVKIGNEAFDGCINLSNINLGKNVIEIGNSAFSNCGVTSITIFDNVNFGKYVFSDCKSLKECTIGAKKVSDWLFSGCTNLESVTFTDNVEEIGHVFSGCISIKNIVFPDSVKSCYSYLLNDCTNLESIVIGKNMHEIPIIKSNKLKNLVINNNYLTPNKNLFDNYELTIKNNLRYFNNILVEPVDYFQEEYTVVEGTECICNDAFANCRNMKVINIPKSVVNCGAFSGYGTTHLTVNSESVRPCFGCTLTHLTNFNLTINGKNNNEIKTIISENVIDNKLTITNELLNHLEVSLMDLIILIKYIYGTTGYIKTLELDVDCVNTETSLFNILKTISGYLAYTENLILTDNTNITYLPSEWNKSNKVIKTIKLPSIFNKFAENAFYNCNTLEKIIISDINQWFNIDLHSNPLDISNLSNTKLYINDIENTQETINLPNDIKSIKNKAFENWKNVKTINIPNTIIEIGREAFEGCDSLESIYYNGTEEEWENVSFGGIVKIGNANLYVNNKKVEDVKVIDGCKILGNKDIVLSDDVIEITHDQFKGNEFITSVIMSDSVTSLSNEAFKGCISLMGVTLSNNIKEIKDYTFENCISIEHIEIPEGITSIGSHAFSNCESLKEITLPNSLTYIGNYAFSGCKSLRKINIPNNITEIDWGAFENCEILSEVTIGYNQDNDIIIGDEVFKNCKSLNGIIFPDSVKTIGHSIFDGCNSLENITFGKGLEKMESEIHKCKNLKNVHLLNPFTIIPERDVFLHSGLNYNLYVYIDSIKDFCENNNVSSLLSYNNILIKDGVEINDLIIPEDVTKICKNCFAYFNFNSIKISNVEEIGTYAFYNAKINDLYIQNIEKWCNILFENNYSNPLSISNIIIYNNDKKLIDYYNNNRTLEIPEGVTKINDYAFINITGLKNISFPDSISEIGNHAFENCRFSDGVSNIYLGDNIISIGDYAFAGVWFDKSKLHFPSKLKKIGKHAFSSIKYLKDVILPDSLEEMGEWCFYDAYQLTNVYIGKNLKIIPEYAFADCSYLTNINIQEFDCESLEEIKDNAFQNCHSLFYNTRELVLPKNVKKVGNNAFDSISVKKIILPEGLSILGSNAFGSGGLLEELYLPKSLIFIQEDSIPYSPIAKFDGECKYITQDKRCIIYNGKIIAFAPVYVDDEGNKFIDYNHRYEQISNYTFPNNWGITGIGVNAFKNTKVDTIVLPKTLANIPKKSFYNSEINNIVISDYTLTIDDYAFKNCEDLTSVFIPESVNTIGVGAFDLSSHPEQDDDFIRYNLSLFFNNDTPPYISPNAFNISKEGIRKDMVLKIYVKDETAKNNFINEPSWALFKDNIEVLDFTHRYMSIVKNTLYINVDSNNNVIGKNQLNFNTLKEKGYINLIANIEVINNNNVDYDINQNAFTAFNSLNCIKLSEGLKNIGNGAFSALSQLSEVHLPESVIRIGDHAFWSCYDLTDIELKDNVEYIGIAAFERTNIKNVYISDKITEIKDYTFEDCHNLLNVDLSKSITKIGDQAFFGCYKLSDVKLSNSIDRIGEYAFAATNISNINLPNKNYKIIEKGTYQGTKIKEIYIPNCVTHIQEYSFNACKELRKISNLHKNLTLIEGFCTNCDNIEEVTGYYVSSDKKFIFYNNGLVLFYGKNIEEYTIPSNINKICYEAFAGKDKLKKINLSNVKYISTYAFEDCISLSDVTNTENVTSIGDSAFYNCSNLENISFSDDVYLGHTVFLNTKISKFNFSCSEDGLCLVKDNTLNSFIPNNTTIKEYDLPENITKIGNSAFISDAVLEKIKFNSNVSNLSLHSFINLTNLKELDMSNSQITTIINNSINNCSIDTVKLPYNLTEIEDSAFVGCTIKNIYCYSEVPPTLYENSFLISHLEDCTIYVPKEKVEEYKQAKNWSVYSSKIKSIE